jgi:hypothetical protein
VLHLDGLISPSIISAARSWSHVPVLNNEGEPIGLLLGLSASIISISRDALWRHRRTAGGRGKVSRLIPATGLLGHRSRLEIVGEDIVGDPDPQGHATNGVQLAATIGARSQGLVLDGGRRLVHVHAIGIGLHGGEHVLGCERVKSPVHAEIDSADGVIEDGGPKTRITTDDTGSDGADLVGDGQACIVWLSEVAVDAVELVRHEVEADAVCCIWGKGQIVSLSVVQTSRLERGSSECGVSRPI